MSTRIKKYFKILIKRFREKLRHTEIRNKIFIQKFSLNYYADLYGIIKRWKDGQKDKEKKFTQAETDIY